MEKMECGLMDKCKTIFPVFCFTALPSFVVFVFFSMVLQMAYWWQFYDNTFFAICGVAAFVLMMFAMIAVSNFVCQYCRSMAPFANGVDLSGGARFTKIEYYYGRENIITGQRPIYMRKVEAGGMGNAFLGALLHGAIIGIVGPIRFVVELLLIFLFPSRCISWRAHTAGVLDQIQSDGVVHFFRGIIRCFLVFLALLLIFMPFLIGSKVKYDTDAVDVSFRFSEKKNWAYYPSRIEMSFYGEVVNEGETGIIALSGTVYYKDRSGNVLYQCDESMRRMSHGLTLDKEHIDKGESFEVTFSVDSWPGEEGVQVLWNTELKDIQIVMEITHVVYEGGKGFSLDKPCTVIAKDFE